jgi:hypothetical protein
MKISTYDNQFNANEWFVLITLVIGFLFVFIFPKRFPLKESIFYLLFGIFIGKFFDHTISIKPFDFYDVNDNSTYQFTDFFSYLMYAPFGYFFIYIYKLLKIKRGMVFPYIVVWSIVAIAIEYFASKLGVYHYKNGYHILFGFPIYLLCQTCLLWLHYLVQGKKRQSVNLDGF